MDRIRPPSIACPNPSVDVLTSITASLDLNRIDSPHAVSLSHSSSEANTKISKRVRWADGINEQIQRTPEINDWIRRRYRERRARRRHVRLPTRLQAHLRAERTAVRTQRYLIRQRTKVLKAGLHNSSGDEVIFEGSEDHRYPRLIRKNDTRRRTRMHFNQFRRQLSDPGPALSAMRQALSEHARDRTPLQMPEHHFRPYLRFYALWYCELGGAGDCNRTGRTRLRHGLPEATTYTKG